MHTRDLLKTMSVDKVALVPVWAEVLHLFPDQYRAALAWAEEVTNVSGTHASDAAYAAASAAFASKDLVDLTITIAAMPSTGWARLFAYQWRPSHEVWLEREHSSRSA